METPPDNQPATKGDLRHLERHTDTRIDALTAHADARIDAVETNQSELRADFRSFSSARRSASGAVLAAVAGGAVGALATFLLS